MRPRRVLKINFQNRNSALRACCRAIALCFLFSTFSLAESLDDSAIRAAIIADSLRSYPGNCPCPYNTDRAGRQCGGRSAWSRRGGYSPICYAHEISDESVRAYRAKLETNQT